MAIIFEAITGEKLFVKTAATLVKFPKELPRYFGDRQKMVSFVKKANTKFWKDAPAEFELKMRDKESILKSIHLEMSRNAKKMFKKTAVKSRQETIQNQLMNIKSGISAYDLLACLFAHIKENMSVK